MSDFVAENDGDVIRVFYPITLRSIIDAGINNKNIDALEKDENTLDRTDLFQVEIGIDWMAFVPFVTEEEDPEEYEIQLGIWNDRLNEMAEGNCPCAIQTLQPESPYKFWKNIVSEGKDGYNIYDLFVPDELKGFTVKELLHTVGIDENTLSVS